MDDHLGTSPTLRPSSASRRSVALVTIAGLLTTVLASLGAVSIERGAFERRFDQTADATIQALNRRMRLQEAGLTHLRNAVLRDHPVSRGDFAALVGLGLRDRLYQGANAIAYSSAVPPSELETYVEAIRQDTSLDPAGHPDFEVRPPPQGRTAYVIETVVPFEPYRAAFGFDLASDPNRRTAIESARDSGDAVATAPLALVTGDGERTGFFLSQAIYDTRDVPLTAPARRRHFVGAVSIVFDLRDTVADLLEAQDRVEVEVYDVGLTIDPAPTGLDGAQLLLDSDGSLVAERVVADGGTYRSQDFDVGDRRWRIVATPGPGLPGAGVALPVVVLLSGLLGTSLLAFVVSATARARDRAVELAEEMTQDLRLTERRLRSLVQGAPDATIVASADGRIELASDQVRDLLGYEPGELVGRNVDELLPSPLREAHVTNRAEFGQAPKRRRMGGQRDLVALHADGREIPVEISLSPVPGPDGRTDVMASLRDVSTQQAAREALERALEHEREAVEQLERTDRMRTTFLGTISHELQTPLTAITGFTDLLQKYWEQTPDEQRRDLLNRIDRNARALRAMIAELLDFTRLERGAVSVRPEQLDLSEAVREVIAQLEPLLATHTVDVETNGQVDAAVDRDALGRVLTNLLTNAARYSPEGGRITVGVSSSEEVATVIVDDEGPGIPLEERDAIFATFYRGDGAVEVAHTGTGIGLAVVRELVHRHGGSVHVEDAPGGGARFVLAFPRWLAAEAPEGTG